MHLLGQLDPLLVADCRGDREAQDFGMHFMNPVLVMKLVEVI